MIHGKFLKKNTSNICCIVWSSTKWVPFDDPCLIKGVILDPLKLMCRCHPATASWFFCWGGGGIVRDLFVLKWHLYLVYTFFNLDIFTVFPFPPCYALTRVAAATPFPRLQRSRHISNVEPVVVATGDPSLVVGVRPSNGAEKSQHHHFRFRTSKK